MWLDPERICNPAKRSNRRIPPTSFKVADIAAFHFRRRR
ncbi:hypothetical protein SC1_01022 [Sphingopyxis sp. C-1]|nr:hypothetical protein SC1_01022 [Sphingopyxis sp. C-1]